MTSAPPTGAPDRPWIPRFWYGMGCGAWLRVLARYHWAITPARVPMALGIASAGVFNAAMAAVQHARYGRRIAATPLRDDPVIIVGHWRSGTTLMHELLALDVRHTFPHTYACFAPTHFLASERIVAPWLRRLLPDRRPMDNMPAGLPRPQEDEFALCNMGMPSPYLTMLFPNQPPRYDDYLDFVGVAEAPRKAWLEQLLHFYRGVCLARPGRLVLKSPLHTARLQLLLRVFPKARIVHMVRQPHEMCASTLALWRRLYHDQALQQPDYKGLLAAVLQTHGRMYRAFNAATAMMPPGQCCDVRYEELRRDPLRAVQRVYDVLELGAFDKVQPALERYWQTAQHHQRNAFALDAAARAQVDHAWAWYFEKYGYAT
ncbi:MAG: sulfotransferase [bacterium]|nr:sulfotransferase [bacterium]